MEQSPSWEADRFSASQEISCILWNLKVHNHIYKCPPPVPILSEIYPVHAPHPTCWRSILILSVPGSFKWSLSLRFSHHNPVCTLPLPHTCYMPCPSHTSWFDHPNNIGWGVENISSSSCSFLHSLFTSSLLGQNILLSTLVSSTLSLRLSLSVNDHVSHPYKTTGKLIILCTIIFFGGVANSKTKDSATKDS